MSKIKVYLCLLVMLVQSFSFSGILYGEETNVEGEVEPLEVYEPVDSLDFSSTYGGSVSKEIYFQKHIRNSGFDVYSFKYEEVGDSIVYEVDYESDQVKHISFFNPPDGDGFMFRGHEAIQVGRHKVYLTVAKADVEGYEEITLGFYGSDMDTDFIFYNTEGSRAGLRMLSESEVGQVSFDKKIGYMSSIAQSGLKINSLYRGKLGSDYVFKLDYYSDVDRNISFFTPPDGDVFMYLAPEGLKAGAGLVYFAVPVEEVDGVEEITMKFYNNDDRNFIYWNNLLDSLEEVDESDTGGISFDKVVNFSSNDNSKGLVVSSISQGESGSNYVYKIDYTSDSVRNVSFFNPPEGDKVMYVLNQGVKIGSHTLYIEVPKSDVDGSDEITILFYWNEKRDFAYFKTSETGSENVSVKKTLGLVDPSLISDVDFEDVADYVSNEDKGKFEVHEFEVAKVGDKYIYKLKYTSDEVRNIYFFVPPDGEVFDYILKDGIEVGTKTLYFSAESEDIESTDKVTIFFANGFDYRGYIYFRVGEALSSGQGKQAIEILKQSDVLGVGYNYSLDYPKSDLSLLEVHDLKYGVKGEYYYFELNYKSDFDGDLSYFNPPDGDVFMGYSSDVIKKGKHTMYFRIPISKVEAMAETTLGFTFGKEGRNYVYFRAQDLNLGALPSENALIELEVSQSQKFFMAKWSIDSDLENVIGYNLYRWENDEKSSMALLTDTLMNTYHYYDPDVKNKVQYHYVVKALLSDGSESEASNEVEISATLTNHKFIYNGEGDQLLLQIGNGEFYNNNEKMVIDEAAGAKPVIKNDRTLVPIRSIVESIGGVINWMPETQMIEIKRKGKKVSLKLNDKYALVEGETVELDVEPTLINNRTYMPLRFILENLDLEVEWDGNGKYIKIEY